MRVLQTRIDNFTCDEFLKKIDNFLEGQSMRQIATINPEFILKAQKNEKFRKILNNCDLNIADGVGIKLAFLRFGKKLRCRLTGADLMDYILRRCETLRYNVFLAANAQGLSTWEQTADSIKKVHPRLRISGANLNPDHVLSSKENLEKCFDLIRQNDVLFVNFGSPQQEIFISSLKSSNYGKIKIGMGVGGSFDYWTGKVRRAPIWMRKIGFEWLFRLIQQPRRFRRIIASVIIFPLIVFLKDVDVGKEKQKSL